MSTQTGGSDPLLLVVVLVAAAFLYTKSRSVQAGTIPRTVYVPGSMPASSGSGAAQVAGGIVGSIMNWFNSTGSTPDVYNGTATTLNSVGTYGIIGGTADDPWYG